MNEHSIAILAACSLASFACRKTTPAEDNAEKKPRVSEDDDKKIAAVTEELSKCMTKLMTAPAGDNKE